MMERPIRICVVVVSAALLAAGCGTNNARTSAPRASAATSTTQRVDRGQTVALRATPGVTTTELARADGLLRATIAAMPKWEKPAMAYAAGYRSIGDAVTGDEHYVNWSYVDDGHILDPQRPESIVYENRNGQLRAVAAMYMLPFGSSFADVPDVGGGLTQWHVHRDLCLTNDPQNKVVAGFAALNGPCPARTSKAGNTPMLHVWVVPNTCGPFASLEGGGAGQIPAGQTRLCDKTNASVR